MKKIFSSLSLIFLLGDNPYAAILPIETDNIVAIKTTKKSKQLPLFNIGPVVGLGSIGLEVAIPLNSNFIIRSNVTYMPKVVTALWGKSGLLKSGIKIDHPPLDEITTAAITNWEMIITNWNAVALVDWHPFNSNFMLSIGGGYNKFYQSYHASIKDIHFNVSQEQQNGFGLVLGIGCDNSNDPEARVNYGTTLSFMLLKPQGYSSYNSPDLAESESYSASIRKGAKDIHDNFINIKSKIDNINSQTKLGWIGGYLLLPALNFKLAMPIQ